MIEAEAHRDAELTLLAAKLNAVGWHEPSKLPETLNDKVRTKKKKVISDAEQVHMAQALF